MSTLLPLIKSHRAMAKALEQVRENDAVGESNSMMLGYLAAAHKAAADYLQQQLDASINGG